MTNRTALLAAAAALAAGCSGRREVPQPPPAVRVEVVAPGAGAAEGARYSGVAQPTTQTPLAFRVPGYVAEVLAVRGADGRARPVAEGDRVRRGDVLARLRDAEYRAKVAQAGGQAAAARAAEEKARADWARASRLAETRSVTRPDLDAAKAQRDAAEAHLAAAEAALEEARVAQRDTALASPVDGDVVRKSVDPGALVGPGVLAFVIADASVIKVVLGVPDVALGALATGQRVAVTSDALPGQRVDARVTRIASAADPTTRNFDVEIDLPNPRRAWKAGMVATVELTGAAPGPGGPLLPFSAFLEAPGAPGRFAVVVVEGDGARARARVREVELGDVVGNRVQVTRGLAPGDRVVSTGAPLVADGERVEVVPAELR